MREVIVDYDDDVRVVRAVWSDDQTLVDAAFLGWPTNPVPYSVEQNADLDKRLAVEVAMAAAAATTTALITDTVVNIPKIQAEIESLRVLLADNTVEGSIRYWRSNIVTNTYSAATMRALAVIIIADLRATRMIARQVLRLAKVMVGDLSSSDVGVE